MEVAVVAGAVAAIVDAYRELCAECQLCASPSEVLVCTVQTEPAPVLTLEPVGAGGIAWSFSVATHTRTATSCLESLYSLCEAPLSCCEQEATIM